MGQIRSAIISGDLKLGEELSERQLAESLGVSKTPVREALAQLRLEGLVRGSPHRGVSVFTLSATEVREMCELRQTFEAAALKFAMERNPSALLAALDDSLGRMERALRVQDLKSYLAEDTLFHSRFFEFCGNSYLLETYQMHVGKIAALRTHLAQRPQHTDKSFQEHREICRVLEAGDLAASLDILDRHIDRTKRSYSSTIEDIAAADRAGSQPA